MSAVLPLGHWQTGIYLGKEAALYRRAPHELRALLPLLLAPFRHLDAIPAATWRNIIVVAVMGIAPLALVAYFQRSEYRAFWALGIYFSVLWALFFGAAFHSTGIRWRKALFAYFGTTIVGMTLLGIALVLNLESVRSAFVSSTNLGVAIPSAIVFIGLPEELTKALVLFAMWRWWGVGLLRTFVFYGLVSGLGFGVYEGIDYQSGPYLAAAQKTGDYGGYYLENMLRLTSLPFFHAVWAGTSAYLIWFAARIPPARTGFLVLAICVPAIFHGLYDALVGVSTLLSLLVVALSIVLLGIYIASAGQLERWFGLPVDDDSIAPTVAAG
jgi:RsiW-degrading membrane proteinase PrsW (M82 family)